MSTLRLTREDFLRYAEEAGHMPTLVDLPAEAEGAVT